MNRILNLLKKDGYVEKNYFKMMGLSAYHQRDSILSSGNKHSTTIKNM